MQLGLGVLLGKKKVCSTFNKKSWVNEPYLRISEFVLEKLSREYFWNKKIQMNFQFFISNSYVKIDQAIQCDCLSRQFRQAQKSEIVRIEYHSRQRQTDMPICICRCRYIGFADNKNPYRYRLSASADKKANIGCLTDIKICYLFS